MTALHDWSAEALSNAYRRGEVSPVEAVQAVLDRIAAWEPQPNATYALDAPGALEAAARSQARWQRGKKLQDLAAAKLFSHDEVLGGINTVHLKHVLGDIQTDCGNVHVDGSLM